MRKRVMVLGDAASVHTEKWVAGLCASGMFDVDLVSMNPRVAEALDFTQPGFRTLEHVAPKTISTRGGNYQYLFGLPRLRRLVRKLRPDVISTLYLTSYGLVGSLLKGRRRLVHFALGTDVMVTPAKSRLHGALARYSLARGDLIVSTSRTMTERLTNGLNVSPAKILTQQYGVADWVIQSERPPARYDVVSNRAWVKNSNLPYLLDALEPYPDLRTAVIGRAAPGLEEIGTEIAFRCERSLNRDRFQSLPYRENIALVAASRFLASLTSSDGASLSLMEAMALGTVPIVSDIAPNREWVEDGVNGFVVPLNDLAAARAVFGRVAKMTEPERLKMGLVNRAIIAERGSFTKNMTRAARLMHDL